MKLNTPWAILLGLLAVACAVLVSGRWQAASGQRTVEQTAQHRDAVQRDEDPRASSQLFSLVASGEGLFVRFNTHT